MLTQMQMSLIVLLSHVCLFFLADGLSSVEVASLLTQSLSLEDDRNR